jgi:membrane protease YdiL (CAAX protease family)
VINLARRPQERSGNYEPFISSREKDVLDIVSISYIVVAVVLGVILMTLYQNTDFNIAFKTTMVLVMGIGGVTIRAAAGGTGKVGFVPFDFDKHFNDEEAVNSIIGMVLGICLIFVVQILTSTLTSFAPASGFQAGLTLGFYVFVAINEEILFRFAIFPLFEKLLRDFIIIPGWILATFATSILFMFIHLAVYGTAINLTLVYVFFSSVILCIVYYMTKRLSVTITVHVFVNAIASNFLIFILSGGLIT